MTVTARPRGGLFRRIFATFVLTVVVSTAVSSVGAYLVATGADREWIDSAIDELEAHEAALRAAAEDPVALEAEVARLSDAIGSPVAVYARGRAGRKLAGDGPAHPPPELLGMRRELRHGVPVAFRAGLFRGSGLAWAITEEGQRRPVALLIAAPPPGMRLGVPLVILALLVGVLGAGAGVLSRWITRRLERLSASAARIAAGDLSHRAEVRQHGRPDELDHLGQDFNEMAVKVEGLLQGQRTLLANVSHELRTPIARMKVLLEILDERVEQLRAREGAESDRPVLRLHKGLAEMQEDVVEIEALIADLLTSGRLELRAGAGVPLQREQTDVGPLLHKVAGKVGAEVDLDDPALSADLDAMLVERLLSNLLANGRRACPEGEIVVAARPHGTGVRITVTDDGPGVAPDDREVIFEPFRRLDAARDRDRGGVGLGLYLCRQICLAHGGTIVVTDRPDGGRGAHFVVDLPARAADAASA